MSRTHWAGGITHGKRGGRVTVCDPGYPACCSGERARLIAIRGEQTLSRADVDCKRCLAILEKEVAAPTDPGERGRP